MTPISPNPYEAPKASFAPTFAAHGMPEDAPCWREGEILIAPVDATLPPRCVKCNKPATMDSPRAYLWHHPGWFALIPVLVYMVVVLFVRKRAVVVLAVCDDHRSRRRNLSIIAYLLGAIGCVMAVVAFPLGMALLAIPSGACIVMGTLIAIGNLNLLKPVRITAHEIHLKGCGPAFLDSLPAR